MTDAFVEAVKVFALVIGGCLLALLIFAIIYDYYKKKDQGSD